MSCSFQPLPQRQLPHRMTHHPRRPQSVAMSSGVEARGDVPPAARGDEEPAASEQDVSVGSERHASTGEEWNDHPNETSWWERPVWATSWDAYSTEASTPTGLCVGLVK